MHAKRKKSLKKYIWLPLETCMRYVCKKGSVASLWRSETAGQIFLTFDEQFVAVDYVRAAVSDGLYSKCTPPPPPNHLSLFYTTKRKRKKKRILNAPLPICLSSNVSTVSVTKRRSARWVKLNGAVSRSHTFTAHEKIVKRLSSRSQFTIPQKLTDTKLQTKW